MKPIALKDDGGRLYAYACGRCHNVAAGGHMLGAQDGPDEDLVAHSLRDATRCCACWDCGAELGDHGYFGSSRCAACEKAHTEKHEKLMAEAAERNALVAVHHEAALAHALDRDAAMLLHERMSDISEETHCAGWMSGLEYDLWSMVQGGDRDYGFMGGVSEEEVAELRRLHEKAGGWWFWHEQYYATFVPTAAWLDLYGRHKHGRDHTPVAPTEAR